MNGLFVRIGCGIECGVVGDAVHAQVLKDQTHMPRCVRQSVPAYVQNALKRQNAPEPMLPVLTAA